MRKEKTITVINVKGYEFPHNPSLNGDDIIEAVRIIMQPELEFEEYKGHFKNRIMEAYGLELNLSNIIEVLEYDGIISIYEKPLVIDTDHLDYPAHTENDYYYLVFIEEQKEKALAEAEANGELPY